jgi:hypothetical protein
MPRRKDLDLDAWQQRVRQRPHEYCCIGCEQKVSDHETVFETREMRLARGAAVDNAYLPLADEPELADMVLRGGAAVGGRPRVQQLQQMRELQQPTAPVRRVAK